MKTLAAVLLCFGLGVTQAWAYDQGAFSAGAEVRTDKVYVRTQVERGYPYGYGSGRGRYNPYYGQPPYGYERRRLNPEAADRANESRGWGERYCKQNGQYGWHSVCD